MRHLPLSGVEPIPPCCQMEAGLGRAERNPGTLKRSVTKRRDQDQWACSNAGKREPGECCGLQSQNEAECDLIRDCWIVPILARPQSNDCADDVLNDKGGAEMEN